MDSQTRTLCHIDPKFTLCGVMERAMDDNKLRVLRVLKDGVPHRKFVVLRVGEFRSKGIALTFCPFCGGRLLEDRK